MKISSFIFCTFLFQLASGYNTYNGFLSNHFLIRQVSVRSAAMGNTGATLRDGLYNCTYNPATLSGVNGLEIATTFTPGPYYYLSTAYQAYTGIGYKFSKYLQAGLSNYHFNYNYRTRYTTPDNPDIGTEGDIPYINSSTLSLASEPVKNLFVGVNLNKIKYELGIPEKFKDAYFVDLGIVKTIVFKETDLLKPSLNLSAGIRNMNGASMALEYNRIKNVEPLPVMSLYGAAYTVQYKKKLSKKNLNTLQATAAIEYLDLLNSKYNSALRSGFEATLLEMVSLRVGFFREKLFDYNLPQVNRQTVNVFTYGIGLQLPFYKLGKLPLNFRLDVLNMPQVNYTYNKEFRNYTSIGLKVNWMLNYEK